MSNGENSESKGIDSSQLVTMPEYTGPEDGEDYEQEGR
jgi:hypothetical protein